MHRQKDQPMPLRMIEDLKANCSRPAIFCDACGEEIRTAADGNYHWRGADGEKAGGGELYFSHKRCCVSVDHAFETESAMELDDLVVTLKHNLKVDLKKAEAKNRLGRSIG